jgi:hypothetical protein
MDRLAPHLFRDILDLVPQVDNDLEIMTWLHASTHTFRACITGLKPTKHSFGRATFYGAAKRGNLAVCRLFKDWGAPVRIIHARWVAGHDTAFWVAAMKGHLKLCRFFRAWIDPPHYPGTYADKRLTVADVRSKNFPGNSALVWAAIDGRLDVCQLFKEWVDVYPDGTRDQLTLRDIRVDHCAILRWSMLHAQVDVCQFLKDWTDPLPDGSLDRLTLDDIAEKHDYSEVLTWGATSGSVDICIFLRRWFQDAGHEAQCDKRHKLCCALDKAFTNSRGWRQILASQYMGQWMQDLRQQNMGRSLNSGSSVLAKLT